MRRGGAEVQSRSVRGGGGGVSDANRPAAVDAAALLVRHVGEAAHRRRGRHDAALVRRVGPVTVVVGLHRRGRVRVRAEHRDGAAGGERERAALILDEDETLPRRLERQLAVRL